EDLLGLFERVVVGRLAHAHDAAVVEAAVVLLVLGHAAEGVALGLLEAGVVAGIAAGLAAVAVARHLLGHLAEGLLKPVEGVGLGARRLARLAAAERVGGILHRALSAAQGARYLLAPLAHLAHEVAQGTAERLLLRRVALHVLLLLALLL